MRLSVKCAQATQPPCVLYDYNFTLFSAFHRCSRFHANCVCVCVLWTAAQSVCNEPESANSFPIAIRLLTSFESSLIRSASVCVRSLCSPIACHSYACTLSAHRRRWTPIRTRTVRAHIFVLCLIEVDGLIFIFIFIFISFTLFCAFFCLFSGNFEFCTFRSLYFTYIFFCSLPLFVSPLRRAAAFFIWRQRMRLQIYTTKTPIHVHAK